MVKIFIKSYDIQSNIDTRSGFFKNILNQEEFQKKKAQNILKGEWFYHSAFQITKNNI